MDESTKWFLMKHNDGTVFGPMSFQNLRQWAVDAYIAPLDKVSPDSHTWTKAPMIPELEMDFLLTIGPDSYYGPTTAGAVREFLANGELTIDSIIINCKTCEEGPLRDFGILPEASDVEESEQEMPMPPLTRSSIRENLQRRIRQLEESLVEERRLRQVAEGLRTKAEARLAELEELLQ